MHLLEALKRELHACNAACRAVAAQRREALRAKAHDRAVSARMGVL